MGKSTQRERWTNVKRRGGEKQTVTKYVKMTNRPSTVHDIIAINFRREMALFLMYWSGNQKRKELKYWIERLWRCVFRFLKQLSFLCLNYGKVILYLCLLSSSLQWAEIQLERTGPKITGLCSCLFSKPNFQTCILCEGQIQCHTGSCIFIAFKTLAIIRGNITDVVENESLYNARKKKKIYIYILNIYIC